ncbi:unnamed protein product [Rhizoctonia solani]|uniref:Extracellular metalloproteinase n=1 Tax=Rhizoctonia solani TaxID=456999 RepID=A0A8H3GXI3_9AGAM|nr:unnamed protein product [Rhizoctonia solani]
MDNYRPKASLGFKFEYGNQPDSEDPKDYIDLSVTQLLYTVNTVHDLYYHYGFDEDAGNFQHDNYGRGGEGGDGDAIIVHSQDGSGFNNAIFMTPPDGQHGRLRPYLWDTANPYRDCTLDTGIVIHKLTHGLSTRLTGGRTNSGCLGWGESGGLGEGWGNFFALMIRSVEESGDFPMGSWVSNKPGGIRYNLYSTVSYLFAAIG